MHLYPSFYGTLFSLFVWFEISKSLVFLCKKSSLYPSLHKATTLEVPRRNDRFRIVSSVSTTFRTPVRSLFIGRSMISSLTTLNIHRHCHLGFGIFALVMFCSDCWDEIDCETPNVECVNQCDDPFEDGSSVPPRFTVANTESDGEA